MNYFGLNRSGNNRGSLTLSTVAPNIAFNNITIIGGRLNATNLIGNVFVNAKYADNHRNTQSSSSPVNFFQLTNCVNIKVLSAGNAGIASPRNYLITSDINSSNIEVYNTNFNGNGNSFGITQPNGKNTNFYNCTMSNLRAGTFIDQPTSFTASGIVAKKIFASYSTPQLGD